MSFQVVINLDADRADEILCRYSSGLLTLKGANLDQGWKTEVDDRITALSTPRHAGLEETLVVLQTARLKPSSFDPRNRNTLENSGFIVLRGGSGQKVWDLLLPDDGSTPVLLNTPDTTSDLRLLGLHFGSSVCYQAVNRSPLVNTTPNGLAKGEMSFLDREFLASFGLTNTATALKDDDVPSSVSKRLSE